MDDLRPAAPRLGQGAANATSTANLRVDYVAWLNRFHVRLVYETYDAFSNSMLERLYNRLLARTHHADVRALRLLRPQPRRFH